MVYRSISTTHLNSNDVNNVLPIPTINYKSSSFTNLTLPPPPQTTDFDPGKQARRSVRRLSIDIERLRLKKDVTTLCTTKRRNSVCRSVCDLSKSGLYDDLKSLKTRRNECVQKQKSDKIAVPCTTTTILSIPAVNDKPSNSFEKLTSWLSEGLEPEPDLEEKNVNSVQCSLPLNRLPIGVVDLLLSMKSNNANDKLKILCLYCDRTFSSQTLYVKHSERVHQAPEGRRLSARKSNSSTLLYPGCSHCHNGKTTSLLIEELPALFHHLIDIHFDKYFACKPCIIRFPTKETLQVHLDQLHEDSKPKIPTTGIHDKRKKRIDRRDKHLLPDNDLTDVSQPLSIQVDLDENDGDKKEEEKSSSDEPILRSSRRQHANRLELMKTSNPRKTRILRNEETILSRLGIAQNRSPRTRRGLKSRTEIVRAETPINRPIRNKNTRSTNNSSGIMVEGIETTTRSSGITKVESLSSTFDENFYESVNGNVRQNLSCHLDGKLHSGPMSPSPLSPVDPVPTVRSTLVTSPLVADSEIHEATAISALTAFPTLLTASQYGAEPMPAGKIKKPITKNSWKWKWDCVKKYKYVNEGGKVVKKVKQPVAGIRDLSKLDMWTQLTMRTKHELVRKQEIETSGEDPCLAVGEAAREDKRKLIEQLNQILDARILPQINLEQNDQRIVKLEAIESQTDADYQPADPNPESDETTDDLPTILQLKRRPVTTNRNEEERVLSGEWARPRCYICYGCGEKFENIRRLEDHKNAHHPHVYSTHYEIVGKELIEGDLFRHFYIPVAALRRHSEHAIRLNTNLERKSNVEVEDSMDSVTSFSVSFSKSDSFDIDSNSRNSKVSATSMSSSVGSIDESSVNDVNGVLKKSCTKCERSYNTMADLYRHMLDCSGDYDWFLAKKRHNIKYRYFGSRRRKVNRPNFGNRRPIRPKKEESDTPRIRDAQTPKPRPSDAESIQRMLANLPPKRVCRQIFPNLQAKKRVRKFMPVNSLGRNRQQIHLKQSNTKTNRNFKFITTTQTTATAIRKNITRRLRFFSTNNSEMSRNTRSAKTVDEQSPEVIDNVTSPKCRGVVKNITRRTQRVFPKLVNSLRRPMQKKNNLRNTQNGSPKAVAKETKTSSILERMNFRKSKRVQVTLKKLDGDIIDMIKVDEKTNAENIDEQVDVTANDKSKKVPAKKRTLKRLIKGIRGKCKGSKQSKEKDEIDVEEPLIAVPDLELKQTDEIQEKVDVQVVQIDESSQSSNRSCSSKRSKRGSIKKQKIVDTTATEANPKERVEEISLPIETNYLLQENQSKESNIQQDVATTSIISEVPMDLSSSKLPAPIVQESLKTPQAKRRTRKLNDCIAMLTGKLQEKLGVPFLNSETNILLSPSVSNETMSVENCEKELLTNQKSDAEIKSIEPEKPQTPVKESSSNHSTPTKRGNRKGRSINFENVPSNDSPKLNEIEVAAIEPINLNFANDTEQDTESNNIDTRKESIQLSDLVIKGTQSSDSDSKSTLKISEEKDVVVEATPPSDNLPSLLSTENNLVLEPVLPLETYAKRSPKLRNSKPADVVKPGKLSPTTRKVGNGKKAKATETVLDESKNEFSPEIPFIPNELICDVTVASKSKRKESKKKLLLETVSLDTVEPVEMESSSIESVVSKRRQTKTSTAMQSSVDYVNEKSTLSSASLSPTEEMCNDPQPVKSTTKSKRGKEPDASKSSVKQTNDENASKSNKVAAKSVRRNRLKDATSTQNEKSQNSPLQNDVEPKTVGAVKKMKKTVKTSKATKNPEPITTSDEVVIPSKKSIASKNVELSDDDEMHPWDPEVGFINVKNLESISIPLVVESPSVQPEIELPSVPCIESAVSAEPNDVQDTIFKSPIDQITPLSSKTNDTKSGIKKKRRKNELAKIIADQLLESFKEVDKSRIEELKLLHDLSIESNDDLLITTTLSRTPPPKRRTATNIRTDSLVNLDTSFEETNNIEDIEVSGGKTTTKRKKINAAIVDSKKAVQNVKLVAKRKMVGQKASKKDGKKKSDNCSSAGYLSDSEICQPKVPVTMRRRLTICDESPKRMSRNSKETEVSIALFDSIKKPRNVNDPTVKQASNESKSSKTPTKMRKRKNRRNILQQSNDDQTDNSSDRNTVQNGVDEQRTMKCSSDKFDNNGKEKAAANDKEKAAVNDKEKAAVNDKEKAAVNDLVAQIINDFTTSTLNSPTTSPIVFGEVTKPIIGLNNAVATKLSTVLNNKKNILNGDILSNGFKNDVSKEITFATLSQPLKNKSIEHIRNTDITSGTNLKQPLRAPFMSPRWEQTEEWNASSKTPDVIVKDPAKHKLWTLNNKDEKLSSEKSLYQSVKDKTKKLFGKVSKKKVRKHDSQLLNNKMITPIAIGIKKPLLRPSILSVSNVTTKVDTVESENCLKKLESNSLFLGKVSNFENDSISKIFLNEKTVSTASDKNVSPELTAENELFVKKNDVRAALLDNMKSNIEKNVGSKKKNEKQPRKNVKKGKSSSNSDKSSEEPTESRSSKKQINNQQNAAIIVPELKATDGTENTIAAVFEVSENVVEIVNENIVKPMKRRKMGSTKRRADNAILTEKLTDTSNASNNLNNAFWEDEESPVKSSRCATTVRKKIVTKSFDPCYESSQDTIISQIVNKIRDANNEQTTESDEDLSLAEIAKSLKNKILNCDDFSNDGIEVRLELSESFVDKSNFINLMLPEQMEPKIDDADEPSINCDNKLTKAYTDIDDSEFLNENTNTELIDMDLEDTASVYTSSMETTVTTSGGGGGTKKRQRKRRHGRSILMKSNRKSKRSDGDFLTPGESYFCDICSKTFRTQGGLATHRTTLTHISKLSEQEFKLKMEPPKDLQPEPKSTIEEDAATKPDITKSPIIESSSQPQIPLSQSPPSVQRHQPIMSPIRNQSMTYLNNIEPISSPEQHDLNYDRYNTTPRSRNHLPIHESSRLALSQEQRFFYECCSMLKGSDRSNVNPSDSPNKYYTLPQRSEVITKPVTPRSNEQYSYVVPEGSKHSKAIPKIDLNQFSDISSDSNPAYSCPQNPSSSETQNIFPIESKTMTEKDYRSSEVHNYELMKNDGRTADATTTVIDREYLETFSDMGDSFPSSQDASESEQYVQTILERSRNTTSRGEGGYHDSFNATYSKNSETDKKRTNLLTMTVESHETKGFTNCSPIESPLHSTSSQSSTLSKPRTKAAMKGYDNFKVSIPTTGLDLQQALNRSPNPSGCKLAALADIALGNDVPNAVGLVRSSSVIEIETSHTLSVDQIPEPLPVQEVVPTVKPQITNKSVGNKLGFNHRKKKMAPTKPTKKLSKSTVKSSPKSLTKTQPRDVYDFEDFDDSADAPILTLSQVRSKPIPSTNIDDDENSEISSYSDREDYNYESMSESDSSVNNLQKKCLIERIFKSVKKTDVKEKDKIEPKKAIPKQELDKLFDGLRQSDKTAKVEEKKIEVVSGANKEKNERSRDRQSKKPREIANLEEEWGMSMNEIVELIGVGQRKTQRRCAANKQKTFAENWSSDEYEDFHATKDIFALIHEAEQKHFERAEMKAGRARSRTARSNAKRESQRDTDQVDKSEDVTNDSKSKNVVTIKGSVKDKENKLLLEDKKDAVDKTENSEPLVNDKKSETSKKSKSIDSKIALKKPAKVKKSKSFVEMESDDSDDEFAVKKVSHPPKASKIKNRRQTISSRPEIHKSTSKSTTNGARVKQNRSVDSRDVKSDSKSKLKPMARRKRKASEMLYYWSSSSDEEFGRIKPRDDNFDDDNLEQHGWIVGDSHKKLVTLLAHAKGKKIEDCAVKEAIHKKKS